MIMRSANGKLVVIEGVNGAGKSSVINGLIQHYKTIGLETSFYKFPNRVGPYGKQIDNYLKGRLDIASKYDILDLFSRDRELSLQALQKDLNAGKIVICDRYIFSNIVYNIPYCVNALWQIKMYADLIGYFDKKMPVPDIVYLIDGNHLIKRGIVARERFYFNQYRATELTNLFAYVITNFTDNLVIIKNKTGQLKESVRCILNDLNTRL